MSEPVITNPAVQVALSDLRAALDPAQVLTGGDTIDEKSHDRSWHEWERASAVVQCRSTADVAMTVTVCARHGVALVPRGAGTGLEGAANASAGAIVLDLSPMTAIIAINDRDFDVVVQAGVMKSQLNAALAPYGLWFPSGPGADASVGGMLSTRASGTQAVAYGTMRESALALTAVLADGSVIRTGTRARKSAAGYDLTHLLVGAEGTLGVITEATLRVHPVPAATAVLVSCFSDLAAAGASVYEVLRRGIAVSRVELLDHAAVRAINSYTGSSLPEQHTVIWEVAGTPAVVSEQLDLVAEIVAGCGARDCRTETDPVAIEQIWQARHSAQPASEALIPGASSWSTDVCVPISELSESIVAAHRDLADNAVTATIVGHVGDGNFHLAMVLPPDDPDAVRRAGLVNEGLVRRAISVGGTCSGEHGIGRGKRDSLRLQYGDTVEVMRRIKHALDPDGILNPEAVFTEERR